MKERLPQILIITVALACLEYWTLLVYCDVWRPLSVGVHLRLDGDKILVDGVDGQSIAAQAGLRTGDQIARADGNALKSRLDWMAVEANLSFDRPLGLTLIRNTSTLE